MEERQRNQQHHVRSSPPSPFAVSAAAAAANAPDTQHEAPPAGELTTGSDAATATTTAQAAAASLLPPRPSLSASMRADSLLPAARSSSLALQPLHPPSLAVWGWGRNDCGKRARCARCLCLCAANSSVVGPPLHPSHPHPNKHNASYPSQYIPSHTHNRPAGFPSTTGLRHLQTLQQQSPVCSVDIVTTASSSSSNSHSQQQRASWHHRSPLPPVCARRQGDCGGCRCLAVQQCAADS